MTVARWLGPTAPPTGGEYAQDGDRWTDTTAGDEYVLTKGGWKRGGGEATLTPGDPSEVSAEAVVAAIWACWQEHLWEWDLESSNEEAPRTCGRSRD